ncbi:hypothetical protein ACJ73_03354 [Blastomyces percursus]|uniref:Uncharacterized protein n=1 Tax=Blastomyces percursus TaxID=1658174 RepID=A0A1J9QYN9_9EURO|nr:hypothetical protein ACJ73_03354 [Blastomyces percursus]
MAISASTEADKRFYCEEIVNVEKTRKCATMKARKARQRAIKADRKEHYEDERILAKFMDFKEEQVIAWERQRQEEQLALLRVREDAMREAEEKERKAIEALGVAKAERESRNSATKKALRAELERLKFPSTQMKSILDHIHVDVNDDTSPDPNPSRGCGNVANALHMLVNRALDDL